MNAQQPLSRRHFLRSSAALIALPALESLGFRRFAAAAQPQLPPKRFIFLNFGWGVTQETWFPDLQQPGANYTLPPALLPLERHKADFSVIQGLTNKYSMDGHSGSTFWLTGANRYAEPGQNFHNSISADQVAAEQLGQQTRFASIQLSGGQGIEADGHGPGLSLAWDVRGKPIGGQNSPLEAFHRLFSKDATSPEKQKALLAQKRSLLDTVMESSTDLQRGLCSTDKAKLEEYFQGIREIEKRLSKEEQWLDVPMVKTPLAEPKPGSQGKEEIQLMYDLMLAALQTDSTRVLSYRMPTASFLKSLDISVIPHEMSHYSPGPKMEASQKRDSAHTTLLAGLLDRLKATRETNGSRLFDHTTVVFGSNLRVAHTLENCPTLVAGGGSGIKLGHNVVMPKGTPLCNLWLTLLKGSGIEVERHGDSTGVI
ncbi:MAG: hypothetical protein RLZZ399_2683 [Verrucomicrobiota bacterium]|jgi:hypothetical protein